MNNQQPNQKDVDLEFKRIQQILIRHCPLEAVPLDSHLHLYADFSKNGLERRSSGRSAQQLDSLTLKRSRGS